VKTCSKCKVKRRGAEFSRNPRAKDGLRSWCKFCSKVEYRKWRAANSEKANAYDAKWAKSNPEKKAKWYKENPEKMRSNSIKWQRENPDRVAQRSARRRARILNQLGNMPPDGYEIIYKLFGRACLKCQTTENMSMDHVIPLAIGGLHDINNLQPLCRPCNSSKGTKTIDYRNQVSA
jgi:5-methylcytosine-specific restriction endonuclease McrA